MNKLEEIKQQLLGVQIQAVTIVHQRDGNRRLFDAACWTNNGEQAAKIREQIHNLLDSELDCAASVMQLSRMLLEMG